MRFFGRVERHRVSELREIAGQDKGDRHVLCRLFCLHMELVRHAARSVRAAVWWKAASELRWRRAA